MTTIHPPLTRAQVVNAYAHGFLSDHDLRRELDRLEAREREQRQAIDAILCASGRHPWIDAEDRRRCCAGYVRVYSPRQEDLDGCEGVVFVDGAGWLGWRKLGPASGEAVAS